MALPDGSMVLVCPVGPEYSMVGDEQFEAWQSDDYFYIEEINVAVFSVWFSNVKRVTTLFTSESDAPLTPDLRFESTGVQWRCPDYVPEEKNTGGHPYPRNVYDDGLSAPYNMEPPFTYLNEDYDPAVGPTVETNYTGIPFIFIHRDKFYFAVPIEYGVDTAVAVEVELTLEHYKVTYVLDDFGYTVTVTYTVTIDQLFYP